MLFIVLSVIVLFVNLLVILFTRLFYNSRVDLDITLSAELFLQHVTKDIKRSSSELASLAFTKKKRKNNSLLITVFKFKRR